MKIKNLLIKKIAEKLYNQNKDLDKLRLFELMAWAAIHWVAWKYYAIAVTILATLLLLGVL